MTRKILWKVTALVQSGRGIKERKLKVCAKPYGVAAVNAAAKKVGKSFRGLTGRMNRGAYCS